MRIAPQRDMSPLEATACGTNVVQRQWTYMRIAPQVLIVTLFRLFNF
ncbi:unnamed protein product [Ectocarpus sp. 4 AP-2014]